MLHDAANAADEADGPRTGGDAAAAYRRHAGGRRARRTRLGIAANDGHSHPEEGSCLRRSSTARPRTDGDLLAAADHAHARIGVLTFGSTSATDYSKGAIAFMEQVAAHVAIAVDNAINFDRARQLTAELRAERDRLQLLIEIGSLLVSHLDAAALLKAISESLRPVVRHNQVGVAVYDESVRALRVPFTYDEAGGLQPTGRRLAAGPIAGRRRVRAARRRVCSIAARSTRSRRRVLRRCRAPTRRRCAACRSSRGMAPSARSASRARSRTRFRRATSICSAASPTRSPSRVENALAYRTLGDRNDQLLDEKQYLEADLAQEFGDIVGKSPALKKVLQTVKTVAPTDATVLILGETGTGKELIARAVHRLSPRSCARSSA